MKDTQDGSFAGLDMDELMEIMDNNIPLIHDCFADFIESWPTYFKTISDAVETGDAQALRGAAHKFKGSLQYLAAIGAVAITLRLESAGKSGDLTTVASDLEGLEMECRALEKYMASQLSG